MDTTPPPEQINSLMVLIRDGRWSEAETVSKTMTQCFPQHEFGWKVFAVVLMRMGRNVDALAAAQKVTELFPCDAEGHSNLGILYSDFRELDNAEISFRRALEINPSFASAHFNLGNVFKEQGRLVEAELRYRVALEIQPDYVKARNSLDNVLNVIARPREPGSIDPIAVQRKEDIGHVCDNLSLPRQVHPYSSLPARNFWRTAVAERDAIDVEHLWQPKFPFTKDDKVITAGSCFAQHISKALKTNGFNWIDAEPAPLHLDANSRMEAGYGVFSFRTGNIYTARQLKQWLFWAFGTSEQSSEVIEEGGRFYDPFRPTIPRDGYGSKDELFAARNLSLNTIRDSIKSADIFVFTLGLTEAWMNADGFTYPLCPGTIRGEFSNRCHVFHNFSYDEVLTDLTLAFDAARKQNPTIKFLLTVSPVPLTATASDDHVLVATTYSKAVLRAAAGYLTKTRADVDYFPSYELISGHPFEGRFFDKNRRTVTREGVAFVMRKFLAAVEHDTAAISRQSDVEDVMPSLRDATVNADDHDEICEEIILETWSRQDECLSSTPPKIILIGDSHFGLMSEAMADLGIPCVGGGIMFASQWQNCQFALNDRTLFEPTEEKSKKRWHQLFEKYILALPEAKAAGATIITNIGMQCIEFVSDFVNNHIRKIYGNTVPSMTWLLLVDEYLNITRATHIALVQKFVEAGYRVICVSDAPVTLADPRLETLYAYADTALLERFRNIGCDVFHARNWIRSLGKSGPNVDRGDGMHGSSDYYRQLVKKLVETFSIGTGR